MSNVKYELYVQCLGEGKNFSLSRGGQFLVCKILFEEAIERLSQPFHPSSWGVVRKSTLLALPDRFSKLLTD